MSAGWVAGAVRARAMSRRRVGAVAARALAGTAEPGAGGRQPRRRPLRPRRPSRPDPGRRPSMPSPPRSCGTCACLPAGCPRGRPGSCACSPAGFEVANVDERLRELEGRAVEPPFHLGSLATTWERAARAASAAEVRAVLARSAWGDPGAESPGRDRPGHALAWAARVAAGVPEARPWACGAAGLIVARELLLVGSVPTPQAQRMLAPLLGSAWMDARSITGLAAAFPAEARWVLDGIEDPADLWRAEAAWWSRLSVDGASLLHRPGTSPAPVVGSRRGPGCRRLAGARRTGGGGPGRIGVAPGAWRCSMPWRESMQPVRMSRVAVLAPRDRLRDVLVEIAGQGTVELEVATEADVSRGGPDPAAVRARGDHRHPGARVPRTSTTSSGRAGSTWWRARPSWSGARRPRSPTGWSPGCSRGPRRRRSTRCGRRSPRTALPSSPCPRRAGSTPRPWSTRRVSSTGRSPPWWTPTRPSRTPTSTRPCWPGWPSCSCSG